MITPPGPMTCDPATSKKNKKTKHPSAVTNRPTERALGEDRGQDY
jgi:hypothetical protein